ncbi:DUF5134 domain-containing protein [Arthrobacter sp. H35-D1]|uniref:DUF5134 domain-containing protein n=1 Tax=Arthrobacter sp. H35-D1 TaxID=3046202 RepID=UPI0024B8A534|nr:DUF5134 domain-containing protein [Arthrobacter sp. H35-D1]MDJ0315513.1 DUF5134 domain-containing protein [Arthrobacter sp. H35-D1]
MIRVFSNPAITWTITAILLLSASYHILQGIRSKQRKDLINNSLHALMHFLMAAMLWHLAPSTMLAQIMVLTGAAMWFIIQAVARPEVKTLCTDGPGRLKCAYHGLTMVGAAAMVAMMGGVTTAGYASAPTNGTSIAHDHHAMAAPVKTTAAATLDHSPNLAILLTVFFAAAAMVFIILLLRFRVMKNTHHNSVTAKRSSRPEHGLEALGAAVMALMFATMTA